MNTLTRLLHTSAPLDLARSLIPLVLLLVAIFAFHLRHRTNRTLVLLILAATAVGIVAASEVYALTGDPDYDSGESWDHHHERSEVFFARLGVVFIMRDVAFLVFTGAMIVVLPKPGADRRATLASNQAMQRTAPRSDA